MNIVKNHSLQSLNTFGLNVAASWFAEVTSVDEIRELFADLRFKSMKKLVLGGGSNVLFTGNYDGLVILNRIEGIKTISEDERFVFIEAGAGINWHSFVLYTIEMNYPGLENLSLIPGCVGAAPIQNIGAYGVEIKNTFHELTAIEMSSGKLKKFTAAECRFGYRDSIFKHEAKDRYAIVNVTFRLDKKAQVNTSYGAIGDQLKAMNISNPEIRDVSNAVISIRRSKLPDPAVIGNAGSFFKNPEIKSGLFESLRGKFPGIVGYPSATGTIKLAAGWLIEQCGWKGKRAGQTGMHEKQALVLVNYGNASGHELIEHAHRVRNSVIEKFGVEMEMEVNII